MQTEIDKLTKINALVQRADGISARIEWINEDPRSYKCFDYENGNTIDNIFLLKNSLSISHGDYLNIFIDHRKLEKPINSIYTKFRLECDIWALNTKTINTENDAKWAIFMREKYKFPRFFDNYKTYRQFLEDCWKCERITITEKDVAASFNKMKAALDDKEAIRVWLGNAGKEDCSCGAIESNVITILCPEHKIMSFRSKRDYESYYNGEEVYDAHHFNIYLASD